MKAFQSATVIIFFCAFALFLLGDQKLSALAFEHAQDNHTLPAKPLPFPQAIDIRIRTPAQAKQNEMFWFVDGHHAGIALRFSGNAELFSLLFPGYPSSMAHDRRLWKSYFSRDFNLNPFLNLPHSQPPFGAWRTHYPSLGCLDVFKNYGADVLVYGNSEVVDEILPSVLSQELSGARVLFCARGGQLLPTMQASAQVIEKTSEESGVAKPKAILLGYSFWMAYLRSQHRGEALEQQRKELELFHPRRSTWDLLHEINGRTYFPRLNWTEIVPFRLSDWWKLRSGAIAEKPSEPSRRQAVPRVFQEGDEEDFRFPANLELTASVLQTLARKAHPRFGPLKGASEKDCDLREAEKQLDQTLEQMLRSAEFIFLYLTPVTPLQTQMSPACLYPGVKQMLRRKETARIRVKVDDWESYGLSWMDFVRPHSEEELQLNQNHTGLPGARKVSRHLGQWLRREGF